MSQFSHEELMQRQRALEQRQLGLGVARYYREKDRRGEDTTGPGRELMRRTMPPLAAAIKVWVEDAQAGKACRAAGLAHFLSNFDAEDVAFITLRQALLTFGGTRRLTTAAVEITNALEHASMSDALKAHDLKAWKRLQTKIDRNPFPNKRYVIVRQAGKAARVTSIMWTRSERVRLGAHLVLMAAEATGLFTIETKSDGKKMRHEIVMDKATQDWLDQAHQRCELQSPVYLPMVVPPRPWKGIKDGGYLDPKGMARFIINGRKPDKAYREELANADMPMVYKAINAVQATAWRVNAGVLRVLQEVWDSGSSLGGLPPRDDLPLPAAPWGDVKLDPEFKQTPEWRDHIGNVARTREANERFVSKRRHLITKLTDADEFVKYEHIYFPHALDWRGRVYPMPTFLSPQGDDTGKALLEFADGCPLGTNGAFWLAVHLANCYGVDKVSFDERVRWVEENQDAILDSALRPLDGARFWSDADAPYQFLAACYEWAGLTTWVAAGKAQGDFVSHLPIGFDGSCNGLQNFSAMLRDPVGGKATNLVPSDKPADIYQQVADVVSKRVEHDAANGEVNAVYWKGKVTRKITKRPTMTLPYGSGKFGFRTQIEQTLQELKLDIGKPYLLGNEFLCSVYMGEAIYDALGEVVVAALSAMGWLREVSGVMAGLKLPIWWRTPAGFPVRQSYMKPAFHDITCKHGDREVTISVQKDTGVLNTKKQAQGISPNFVHSLDAAHLMRTVSMCADAGITSLAMVHDSYGCHAGRAEELNRLLRRAFIEQYSGNVLDDFRQQLIEQLPEDKRDSIQPLPEMGTLDLTAVERSEYFFA